jgi:phosphoribosylanthranilate isomerase
MSVWVKICGNTSLADAQVAAEAGADALGFVFASSPRRVTPEAVAAMTPRLPAELEKIGVFVHSTFDEIAATVERCGLTGVQLHAETLETCAAQLRARFGPTLRLLQVVHFGAQAADELRAFSQDPFVDAILIDSRTATAVGGTGVPFDWKAARAQLFSGQSRPRLVVAGGLNPENVAEAITTLHPWGVDVVTGVESAPGHKDPDKVRTFVAHARQAAAHLPAPACASGLL